MSNEKTYRINDVCKELGISVHTIQKWYQWERYALEDGSAKKHYLPQPQKLMDQRGKPKFWTEAQLKELKKYKDSIVVGRYGKYGKYSNPLHKEDK